MLQPKKKSFAYYIQQWYEYALWEKISDSTFFEKLEHIYDIDNSILIIDDILDKSEERNWKPSLYKEIGIEKAIIEANLKYTNAISYLLELGKICKISAHNQIEIIKKIYLFVHQIYQGQKIDQMLPTLSSIDKKKKKYFEMITLFTWGHIKFWLEIWQLLANKIPNESISKIADSLWIIRQIYDDFSDYFPSHHEMFWDFANWNNRLPEILFLENNWVREEVLWYIKDWNENKVREIVLNKRSRELLFDYCEQEEQKIKEIDIYIWESDFDYKELMENYDDILTKKL